MLYPQNGDRIETTHNATSHHPVYFYAKASCQRTSGLDSSAAQWRDLPSLSPSQEWNSWPSLQPDLHRTEKPPHDDRILEMCMGMGTQIYQKCEWEEYTWQWEWEWLIFTCAKIPIGRLDANAAWTAYYFLTAICDFSSYYVEHSMTLTVWDSELRFWNWDRWAFAFWTFCILIIQRLWHSELRFWGKTVECLHFEHLSSFDYSVINVVH